MAGRWSAAGPGRPARRTSTLSAVTAPVPPTATEQPGWFPDPNGRHEHRYFNGRAWTADVADGGERAIDPLGSAPTPVRPPAAFPPSPPRPERGGLATASLVCGIIGVLIAWLPFLVVGGVVLAILALVFGVKTLRSGTTPSGARGKSIAGVVLGAVALALAVLGAVLSVVVVREVLAFMDPAAHTVEVTDCRFDGGVAIVAGTLTNLDDEPAGFSLFVTVEAGGRFTEEGDAREIDSVAPGATVEWQVATNVDGAAESCVGSVEVFGPLPFGVPVERP